MTCAFINRIGGLKRVVFQGNEIAVELFVVATILFLFTSCAQPPRHLSPSSPIDLKTAKSVPVGEAIIFGRVNVVTNDESFIWDEPLWDKFHLYLMSDSDSEPVVYTLAHDGTFSWHLPPGDYTITSFKWMRGNHYLIRPVFANFSVSEQLEPAYIGELVIKFMQTGARAYSKKTWKLPRAFPEMQVVDNDRYGLHQQQINIPGAKGAAKKRLMRLEKKQ
ncbi:hypothetical protein SAMN05216419_100231 [Nitrosomonas cryotolerans]|uniref:Uncharacterized protein n=1 Tax=Nitrosomonas cryotolerans ATCC 49181 TaxID=1131553 RepID=A0A1N6GQW1_9PROT|nr:hypothetical protein [Nitrosomonas cryotolerans]SFP39844.1 hypothetical protein SAMN05216419_100231 [Nitrosomonas cryotolerans]SIO09924.1 hypothetical protein SAMN02743940_0823 [Nitrosomonas cryotolerans ATCC 49181]